MKTQDPPKLNVLAVDDQPANLVALEAVLGLDFNLFFANSGPEAISFLEKQNDVDVVLMDIQMPCMDGFEAASRIKRMDGCEDISIVFITAFYKEEPFVKKGYEVGGLDYFSKPFDPDILKKKIAIYGSFGQMNKLLKERERTFRKTEELLKAGRDLISLMETLPVDKSIRGDLKGRIEEILFSISSPSAL